MAAIITVVIMHFVLSCTTFGLGVYLYGSNSRAAEVAGLPTQKNVLGANIFCSLFIAVVAMLLTARTGFGEPNLAAG